MAKKLIVGLEYDGAFADIDIEISEALNNGAVPTAPLFQAGDRSNNEKEQVVQSYLTAQSLPASFHYQSLFIADAANGYPTVKMVEPYGHAFIVKPHVFDELKVASIGDMQTLICEITREGKDYTTADPRVVSLSNSQTRDASIEQMLKEVAVLRKDPCKSQIFIEARGLSATHPQRFRAPLQQRGFSFKEQPFPLGRALEGVFGGYWLSNPLFCS
ncbi:hypothetical protein [Tunturiibacter gelidiferens]|uniref:hypothetical protein n=1 Tax=Tunturiibacter gelidiferens TaxID=3069689 RepID=UPI003D9B2146